MDLTKKTVHYTQEGKTVFDRFYLDEDYNVPEPVSYTHLNDETAFVCIVNLQRKQKWFLLRLPSANAHYITRK